MKVFIGWSGTTSHDVALVLDSWLPSVLQFVEPFISSEDIDKGAAWDTEVARALEDCDFGIVCVTPTNTTRPWLHFEAGALSKAYGKSRVVPFLFGLARTEIPQGPLVRFQSVVDEREDVFKLVKSINGFGAAEALDEPRLRRYFDKWWPDLAAELARIDDAAEDQTAPRRSEHDILGEILELVRDQQKAIADSRALLPHQYVNDVLARTRWDALSRASEPLVAQDLYAQWQALRDVTHGNGGIPSDVAERIDALGHHIARAMHNDSLRRDPFGDVPPDA